MADFDLSRPVIIPKKTVTTITGNTTTTSMNTPHTTIQPNTVDKDTANVNAPQIVEPNDNDISIPTDSDLDKIIQIAKEVAESNEDIEAIRAAEERTDEERLSLETKDAIEMNGLPEGVTAAEREFAMDSSGKPIFTKEGGELPVANLPIDKVDDLDQFNDDEFKERFMENTKSIHNLSDDDALALLDILTAYRRDKSINVYAKMPETVKNQVKEICMSANIPMTNANSVAKMMMEEMISETATDQTFIDFEKSLNEAMKIPSLIDLYEEHMNDTMNIKLPAMADAIEKEDPVKAKMLRDIAVRYDWARDYSFARETYENTARIRKYVRKRYGEWKKFASEMNYANDESKFRMPDATTLYPILLKQISNDPENDITEEEVQKFLTLILTSCDNMDNKALLDAAYIYYLLKDITMLAYVNDQSSQAADTFSAELISNIKALIYYIRAKEDEFYASNQPRERSKK